VTQYLTTRHIAPGLPGQILTPAESPGREPESLVMPFVLQELTFTVAGAPDPLAADGVFSIAFPAPWGGTITVAYAATAGQTLAQVTAGLRDAWNNGQAGFLYAASAAGLVLTTLAKAYDTQIPVGSFTTQAPVGYTITPAQSVAAAAPTIRMGVFCRYGALIPMGAVIGTPRQGRTAAELVVGTTLDQVRGVVAREVNSVELSPTFQDATTPDQYPPGHYFPVLNRGEICTVVDPGSGAMAIGSQVHIVKNPGGLYQVRGAVADAADGGNTLRADDTPTGHPLARVTVEEWTLRIGAFSVRLCGLKVNRAQ